MNRKSAATLSLIATLLLAADRAHSAPPAAAAKPEPLAIAVNDVGFALLKAETSTEAPENVVFSPLSVAMSLGMLRTGASGKTADELFAAAKFSGDPAELAGAWSRLLAALDADDDRFTLRIGGRLWGAADLRYQPPFLQTLRENYRAELFLLDFAGDSEGAAKEVNAWLAEETSGRIELSEAAPLPTDTALLLTSSFYFRGVWSQPFLPQLTEQGRFGAADSAEKIPLMRQVARLRYAEDPQFQLVELPYRGERVTFAAVLPRPESAGKLLGAEELVRLRQSAQESIVELTLPRFKTLSSGSLKRPLADLGVKSAFAPEADFTPIAGKSNMFLQDVRHQALIDLDESGTEAAAVTTAFVAKSVQEPEVSFRADRPFQYFLIDQPTQTILLMGRLVKP